MIISTICGVSIRKVSIVIKLQLSLKVEEYREISLCIVYLVASYGRFKLPNLINE